MLVRSEVWAPTFVPLSIGIGYGCASPFLRSRDTSWMEFTPFLIVTWTTAQMSLLLLLPGLLRALKWWLDWNFKIALLHHNAPEVSGFHQRVVMPTCGVYGQVMRIREEVLVQVRSVDSTTFAHEVLSEHFYTIRWDDHLETWRAHIARELLTADCAVFDWHVCVKENMEWELREALSHRSVARLLIFCEPAAPPAVKEIIGLIAPRAGDALQIVTPPHYPSLAVALFRAALRERLAALHVEPRRGREAAR